MSDPVFTVHAPQPDNSLMSTTRSSLRILVDEIMQMRHKSTRYLAGVWRETREYFMPYRTSNPSGKRLVRIYFNLTLRVLFIVLVTLLAWHLIAASVLAMKRLVGGGPNVHYDTLLNTCERTLFVNDHACGVLVSDGPNSLLCVWEDDGHTRMATFLNPQTVPDPLSRVTSKEHVLACSGLPDITRVRGTSVTVYYTSVQHPGVVSARFIENMRMSVCIQHAMEFPHGSPCPY
jgi:hypothetical protein